MPSSRASSPVICIALALWLIGSVEQGYAQEEPATQPPNSVPLRVVSMNLCTDELLLELAPVARIAALSHLVRDPQLTWYAQQAADIKVTRGRVEELLALQPDLIIGGAYSSPLTVAMLRRLGHRVELFEVPRSIAQIEQQLARLGDLLQRPQQAQKVVARMRDELDRIRAMPGPQGMSALLYRPNGLTADAGSLAHDVMHRAGLRNVALQIDLPSYGRVSLERLIMLQPQLLVFDQHSRSAPSLAQQLLQHPALRHGEALWRTVAIPAQAWTCGSPAIVRAVRQLRSAASAQHGKPSVVNAAHVL